jgi:hypothetical protein
MQLLASCTSTARGARIWRFDGWRGHVAALLTYIGLSVVLSWPTITHFTTALTTSGEDARHNLWIFWHVLQALRGAQPLFEAPLLYYPHGISLLVHGVGPVTALFALPFWPLGPEAAYNGALLVSLSLTGYCSYLLARDLGMERSVALFAGTVVLASPMCLAGLNNHVTKVFLGAMPLTLLALQRALDTQRSRWWAVATGLGLLLTLLHTGYQFVFVSLAAGFFTLAALRNAERGQRRFVLGRAALVGLAALLLAGPLLLAIVRAASDPSIVVDVNAESFSAPDLVQYVLPSHQSRLFGWLTQTIAQPYLADRSMLLNSETEVSLSAGGILLCMVAWWRAGRVARRWVVLLALCMLFSLGPELHVLARNHFTEYDLPVILPYAFLTGLPGLSFMRSPGRFMMLGFVAFGIATAFGLAWLRQRFPAHRRVLLAGATMLILIPAWPKPFPQEALRPVPPFYQQIAADTEQYGVFDLPLKSSPSFAFNWKAVYTSSYYQIFQIVHQKGIAGGYISRTYGEHPVFADILTDNTSVLRLNGRPAVYADFLDDLARNNYRYVVLHKDLFGPTPAGIDPGEQRARALLNATFAGQAPIVDDALTRVYRVQPSLDAVTIRWGTNWRPPEPDWRWATSPATLRIDASRPRPVLLQLTPSFLHDPKAPNGLGERGRLTVQTGSTATTVELVANAPAIVPLTLAAGSQTITMTLAAGNFHPPQANDKALLSFAMKTIDLRLLDQTDLAPDIHVDGQTQRNDRAAVVALYGAGWYDYEVESHSRWSRSPAQLLIYSWRPQEVYLHLTPETLFTGASGLGAQATLRIATDDGPHNVIVAHAGQVLTAELGLRPGWNQVTITSAAGNFQPSELFSGNGDRRTLSFKLKEISITTRVHSR